MIVLSINNSVWRKFYPMVVSSFWNFPGMSAGQFFAVGLFSAAYCKNLVEVVTEIRKKLVLTWCMFFFSAKVTYKLCCLLVHILIS